MEHTIDTSQPFKLNWSAKGIDRIIQNVWNLINTYRYEIAYNRTMGINPEIFDKPAPIASAQYTAEVFQVVSTYEPRATVKEVKYLGLDYEGNMQFRVVIEI